MTSRLRLEAAEEGRLIRQAWSLYRRDIRALIGGTIVAGVIGAAVAGIAVGIVLGTLGSSSASIAAHLAVFEFAGFVVFLVMTPLIGGLIGIVCNRVRHGSRGHVGDIFFGFERFVALVLATVIMLGPAMAAAALLGRFSTPSTVLYSVLESALALPFVYLLPVIVDQRVGIRQALPRSLRLLRHGRLGRTLIALVGLIVVRALTDLPSSLGGSSGWELLGIAVEVVVAPALLVYVVCMYFRARGEQDSLNDAIARPDPPRVIEKPLSVPQVGSAPLPSRPTGPGPLKIPKRP